MLKIKKIGLVLGPTIFIVVLNFFISRLAKKPMLFLHPHWIAIWWITEAIPIAATALLPIVLFPLSGGLELSQTTSSYGHKFVFLLGGFILAIAIEKWNLPKIALHIINLVGTNIML